MGRSYRIGKVADIPLLLHWTFLLIPAWIILSGMAAGSAAATVMLNLSLVAVIFGCVVLHELGHAMAARHFGIQTKDIVLMPIGGVARLMGMPRKWQQELAVALAGPAVNVVIALGLMMFIPLFDWNVLATSDSAAFTLYRNALYVNVAMIVFNMLPLFPMDGGRVLRSLLSGWLGHLTGTRIAATVGKTLAVALGLSGLFVFGNPMLLFIAGFVYFGARQESAMAEAESAFDGLTVADAMMTRFDVLPANTSVDWALRFAMTSHRTTLPVVSDGRFLGFVNVDDLVYASAGDPQLAVERLCCDDVPTLQPGDPLFTALQKMSESPAPGLPVVNSEGYLLGLLNPRSIRQAQRFSTLLRSENLGTFRESPDELREHFTRMQL